MARLTLTANQRVTRSVLQAHIHLEESKEFRANNQPQHADFYETMAKTACITARMALKARNRDRG